MRTCISGSGSRGFGRLDLVFTLGVVVVLVSVACTSIPRSRRDAARSACLGNLKTIGTAHQMWLHDFEDRPPWMVAPGKGGSSGKQLVSEHLLTLTNYLPNPAVLSCPGLRRHRPPTDNWATLQEKNIGYALNPDARVTVMEQGRQGSWGLAAMFVDMDLEGGRPTSCVRCGGNVMAFQLGDGQGLSWSRTNHIDSGNLLLMDGTVLAADNVSLRRQASLWGDGGQTLLHLVVPK